MRTQLKKDEKVALITKLHWFPTLFNKFAFGLLCSIIGIKIGGYGLCLTIAAILFCVYKYFEWQKNIWIVTNFRVIDEFGLLSLNAKESPLDKINNVSFSQNFMERNWGYGTVVIQTAAGHGATTYSGVENPQKLKDTITTMQEEYKNSFAKNQAKELANIFGQVQQNNNSNSISVELEKLFDLKLKGIISEDEYNKLKAKLLNA
ncbi:MAG: PH domain-containing protein [Sphingobacteriales bacterium]|nr:PH domain-containing protein [Sphingobacteriales bacterium]